MNIRITGGITTPNSILRPVLDMVSTISPLNRYITLNKIKEYALLKIESIYERVFVIRGMLWHLADYKSLLDEMLEPINYRFTDRLLNDRPYDYSLF
jgi:hypothetical protein